MFTFNINIEKIAIFDLGSAFVSDPIRNLIKDVNENVTLLDSKKSYEGDNE